MKIHKKRKANWSTNLIHDIRRLLRSRWTGIRIRSVNLANNKAFHPAFKRILYQRNESILSVLGYIMVTSFTLDQFSKTKEDRHRMLSNKGHLDMYSRRKELLDQAMVPPSHSSTPNAANIRFPLPPVCSGCSSVGTSVGGAPGPLYPVEDRVCTDSRIAIPT